MAIDQVLTILILLAGFYMAWNIGANDVANAMGTSVGSGALTLFKAIIVAGVLEFCGAFFLGSHVSKTIQTGVVNLDFFTHDPNILLYGMLSTLLATALWLQISSYFGWPVSTTHAIIGALLGFGTIIGGMHTVHWAMVGKIMLSWVISPSISALFAFLIFSTLQRRILFAMNPILASKRTIPIFTAIVLIVFTLSTFFNGLGGLQIKIRFLETLSIALIVGCVGMLISMMLIKKMKFPQTYPRFASPNVAQQAFSLNKALKHLKQVKFTSKGEKRKEIEKIVKDIEEYTKEVQEEAGFYTKTSDYQVVEKMFAALQVLSASYVAFAHGANDIANAIGPVAAALEILKHKAFATETYISPYLLGIGGIGLVIGLATWGWRVMETIGRKITELTPTRGFSAEFGAATTILIASKLGLPISTTHCIVGGVLGVGLARGLSALNLRTLRDIILSWIITIPSSAIVCILIFEVIRIIFS
jgi:PiT family inorganic phosphate transporter